jgi:hypothetical protein
MRLFAVSAMYSLPAESSVTPEGPAKLAAAAGPPSPVKRFGPHPAMVVSLPVGEIRSTRSPLRK